MAESRTPLHLRVVNRSPLILLALCLCLATPLTWAAPSAQTHAGANDTGLTYDAQTGTFTQPLPPPGGWQAFANLLQKVTPSVNTAIPLTPAEVTRHVARLIDSGKAQAALTVIAEQEQARKKSGAIGTDVQLEYQRGRALDALGRYDQAMDVWRQMTTDFPELPEPWNALAIEYARRGSLQQAKDALDMALVSVPNFAPALENLGRIQMQLAQESFAKAKAAATTRPAAQQAPASPAPEADNPYGRDTRPQPAAQ